MSKRLTKLEFAIDEIKDQLGFVSMYSSKWNIYENKTIKRRLEDIEKVLKKIDLIMEYFGIEVANDPPKTYIRKRKNISFNRYAILPVTQSRGKKKAKSEN